MRYIPNNRAEGLKAVRELISLYENNSKETEIKLTPTDKDQGRSLPTVIELSGSSSELLTINSSFWNIYLESNH